MSTRIGTPYYVSPEVLLGRTPYSKACDMWSIGVVVYFMLHGYPPFHEDSESRLFQKIQKADFTVCEEEVSPLASDFIKRLLRADPRQRMTIKEAL